MSIEQQRVVLCCGYRGGHRDGPISPAQAALPPPWAGTELWPSVAAFLWPMAVFLLCWSEIIVVTRLYRVLYLPAGEQLQAEETNRDNGDAEWEEKIF